MRSRLIETFHDLATGDRKRSRVRRLAGALTLLSIAIAAVPVRADFTDWTQVPEQARGVSGASAYALGDVDTVNLFNGNLALAIPLGPAFAVGPSLSYGFALQYNSLGWDVESHSCLPSPTHNAEWFNIPVPDRDDRSYEALKPRSEGIVVGRGLGRANAGFGWGLQFGRLLEPGQRLQGGFQYMAPDGSIRRFSERLRPGAPAGPQSNVWYAGDGSYLRLRFFDPDPEPGPGNPLEGICAPLDEDNLADEDTCALVDFPDGEVHEFRDFGTNLGAGHRSDWRLVRRQDPFGNFVELVYPDDTNWVVRDSLGRSHTVTFAPPSAGTYSRVESVTLSGGTAPDFTLHYDEAQTLDRHDYIDSCYDDPPSVNDPFGGTVEVDLLARVARPDGSYYAMTYFHTRAEDSFSGVPGAIKTLLVPTGALYRWTYDRFDFRNGRPDPNLGDRVGTNFPVRTKTVEDPFHPILEDGWALPPGTTEPPWAQGSATWTYEWVAVGGTTPAQIPCHHEVTVDDPSGVRTVSYFATAESSNRPWYGLPYSTCQGNFDPDLGYLSSQVFSVAADGTETLLRSRYIEYEDDGGPDDGIERNHRVKRSATVYHDDGDRVAATVNSDFDGYGHWRQTTSTGWGGVQRTTNTDWNAGRPFPQGQAFWNFGFYSRREVADASGSFVTEHCFDDETGFERRSRQLVGTVAGPDDVVMVFEGDAGLQGSSWDCSAEEVPLEGRTTCVRWYGGDGAELGTEELCSLALGDPAFQLVLEHQHGVPSSATSVVPATGREILRHFGAEIDLHRGLVNRLEDASGVGTVLTYDRLSRLKTERRDQGAWSRIDYTLPTRDGGTSNPQLVLDRPKIETRACVNGTAACNGASRLTYGELVFDGLGRVFEDRTFHPDGLAARRSLYDDAGRLVGASTAFFAGGQPAGWTRYEGFDAFGRPGRVEAPDGGDVLYTRTGDRILRSRSLVATEASGSMTPSWRFELMDGFGRLTRLCEGGASTGDCSAAEASYDYDARDQLVRVCQEPGGGGSCGQIRTFGYDGRGFLVSETHPELPGQVATYVRDALGNALERSLSGAPDEARLLYRYDPASRLVRVSYDLPWVLAPSEPRPLVELLYHSMNPVTAKPGEKAAGKLYQQKRHNWISFALPEPSGYDPAREEDYVVTDTFRYAGTDGALSQRTTRLGLDYRTLGLRSGYSTDGVGRRTQLSYEPCLFEDCAGDPQRSIDLSYTKGFLKSISTTEGGTMRSLVPALTYHPSGLLGSLTHGNGVRYDQAADASGMPRPASLSTTASPAWNSGAYTYDPAGNPTAIGDETYFYDRLGRLTSGTLAPGTTQTAQYDVFGNLTRLITTEGGITDDKLLTTQTSSNRLTTQGASYGATGGLEGWTLNGIAHTARYDALGRMKEHDGGIRWWYLLDADGERVATVECVDRDCSFVDRRVELTPRDPSGRVLRTFDWFLEDLPSWRADYVHRDTTLLAAIDRPDGAGTPERFRFFHADHLGSPRQVTGDGGAELARHQYFPYGEEVGPASGDAVPFQFTGHERDAGFLDAMHARHYAYPFGRFTSLDPVLGSPGSTQGWNRYAYAAGNPALLIDPDGKENCVAANGMCGAPRASEINVTDVRSYLDPNVAGLSEFATGYEVETWDAFEDMSTLDQAGTLTVAAGRTVLTALAVGSGISALGGAVRSGLSSGLGSRLTLNTPTSLRGAAGFTEGVAQGLRAEATGATELLSQRGLAGMTNFEGWGIAVQRGFYASMFGRGLTFGGPVALPGGAFTLMEQAFNALGHASSALGLRQFERSLDGEVPPPQRNPRVFFPEDPLPED